MNKQELLALIEQGEGFHLEFKESINSNLSKEIVAFANAKGGMILVGVADNGTIKNKVLGNDDKSKVQTIARECDPPIDINLESVHDEPNVFVVHVSAGLNKPYRCTGGFYMREGANSNKRTTEEIRNMFIDAERFSFDDQLCPQAEFSRYFVPQKLKRFFTEAKKEQSLSDVDTLHNLGVLKFVDSKPILTNTGVLFFVDNPSFFIRQSVIQCVRYKGNVKVDIEDQKDLTSDIITNIDEAFVFLRRSLDVGFEINSSSLQRQEVWEIPIVALREAVVNAIAHRDYVNRGTHIQIEVFDDRVSITNFGGLAKGFTKDDLGKRSAHRNPNIVDLLHRANFIEKLGTGILRINQELERVGQPPAEFDVNEYWFSIIFKRSKKTIRRDNSDAKSLSERDISILKFCESSKSRAEILSFIGISNTSRNYNNNIKHLVEQGYLDRTLGASSAPNQKYFLTEAGANLIDLH